MDGHPAMEWSPITSLVYCVTLIDSFADASLQATKATWGSCNIDGVPLEVEQWDQLQCDIVATSS